MSKKLCIYHYNCPDGFTAAWAVHKALGNEVEFYPGIHGEKRPDVKGRDVIMVDFAYQEIDIKEMLREANSILILDHHITAIRNLEGMVHEKLTMVFDLDRSGAGLAWDHYHPHGLRPLLVDLVEDRDLWRWSYGEQARELLAAIDSFEFRFDLWDELADNDILKAYVGTGKSLLRRYYKDLDDAIRLSLREVEIGGYKVPLVNVSHIMASDAGNRLSKDKPFAASYYDAEDTRRFSLRSAPEGMDVSEIAAQYNGGGHKHAAGFSVPRHHPLAKV